MAVRDLLWACPLCRAPGAIRPAGRGERCSDCGTAFRRGRGARIVAVREGRSHDRPAGDWLRELGPPVVPDPRADGVVLGPEPVKVKVTRGQAPLSWRGNVLGWVEEYGPARRGTLTLHTTGLELAIDGAATRWTHDDVTGLQPASSSIQLGLHEQMVSIKFLEGSVRLWTRALADALRLHHRACGREVIELQPFVRTRVLEDAQ
jgi:hypothetical protein